MKKENTVVLTPEGYLELEAELNDLKLNKRPEVINSLKYARSLGDLSENADYDAFFVFDADNIVDKCCSI